MIGLSFSFCIQDIAAGRVPSADVEKIISSARAEGNDAWDRVISSYKETYWSWDEDVTPERAEEIARQLIDEGKVEQPRLIREGHHPNIGKTGRWVESEDDIQWNDSL